MKTEMDRVGRTVTHAVVGTVSEVSDVSYIIMCASTVSYLIIFTRMLMDMHEGE